MKTNKSFLLVFIVLICNIAVGFCQTKKVAVLNIVDKEDAINYGVKLLLMGKLSDAITNTPGYEAYERTDIASIMSEHAFQRTGFVNSEQIKRLGAMTGADYILIAEVAKFDDSNFIITAKILNVETAKLDKSADVQTTADIETIDMNCRILAAKLLSREVTADNFAVDDEPFFRSEQMPSFQGGDLNTFRRWVQSNVQFPQIALMNGIQGRVTLTFVIEKDGRLTNIQVLQSPHPSLSEEAIRVLSQSPKWSPGLQRNTSVRVKYTLPVDFKVAN